MPMKIFPFFFCPAKNLTPMFSGHPLFCLDPSSWVKRHCFVSSWSFRSLLAVLARELCQPQSAPFPCCGSTSSWKGHCVIARNLSSSFSWGKARGKVCSKFLLGPKQSHKVILYMDKLVGVFFARGGSGELWFGICFQGWDTIAGIVPLNLDVHPQPKSHVCFLLWFQTLSFHIFPVSYQEPVI